MLRPATTKDFQAVTTLRRNVALDRSKLNDPTYRTRVQQTGFLFTDPIPKESFLTQIADYVVAELEDRIAGYAQFHTMQPWSPEEDVNWFRPDLKTAYFNMPHAQIYGIAVDPSASGSGTGAKLLAEMINRAKNQNSSWLFSMIVTSPLTNIASLLFHERHGFERIAQTKPAKKAGLEDFANLLYGKRLQ